MTALKRAALQLGFDAGIFEVIRFAAPRRKVVILMFHRFFGDGEGHSDGLPIHRFAESMEYLARYCRVVSLRDLTNELQQGVVQRPTVVVTIDDGYHEVFTLAAPVMRHYEIPASVFVVSDFIDGQLWPWLDRFDFVFGRAPHEHVEFRHRAATHVLALREESDRQRARQHWREYAKRLTVAERDQLLEAITEAAGVDIPTNPPSEYRPLTWGQLRTLAGQGFDVGGHTRTHPILSRVEPEQLRSEIEGCKDQIEQRLGFPVRHFAYPNGRRPDYTAETVAAVAKAGYLAAVTAVWGGNAASTPLLELHRIDGESENLADFAWRLTRMMSTGFGHAS